MSIHSKPFTELFNKTFDNLSKMIPGQSGKIESSEMAKQYGIEIAIDVCKEFIDQNPDFQLSNDYKFIQRINKWHSDHQIDVLGIGVIKLDNPNK